MPGASDSVPLDKLVEQAPDALIFADAEGIVRVWNDGAERVFGIASSAAVGASLDAIVPDRFRDAHWTGYRRAIADGETKYAGQALPTRAAHPDGRDLYVELSFSIVRGDDGEVLGALAFARDITERWTAEREQRQRIRDLEAALESEKPDAD